MKILFQRTIQAILNAEVATRFAASHCGDSSPRPGFPDIWEDRELVTRLGSITLQMPGAAGKRFVSQFLARYSAVEMNFLLMLGRISVRGRASFGAVRDMAEGLCGCRLDAERIDQIAAAITEELPNYLQRDLERERWCYAVRQRPSALVKASAGAINAQCFSQSAEQPGLGSGIVRSGKEAPFHEPIHSMVL